MMCPYKYFELDVKIKILKIKSVIYSFLGTLWYYKSATDWQVPARKANMVSFKLINIDFLNYIRYFSIKWLPNCSHEAGWILFQT